MDLPETLEAKNTMHGSGAKGMAMYIDQDTQGLGVVIITKRERGNAPFTSLFVNKWMPGQEFNSYAALRIAASAVTDEMAAAEKAKYPQLVEVWEGDHPANKCMRHRQAKSVLRVSVATCWIPMLGEHCGLCEECRSAATGNGQGVIDIMDERRAAVTKMPRGGLNG